MKTFLPLLLLLSACTAVPDSYTRTFSENVTCTAGTCTRSAPTATSEGIVASSVESYRVSICAPSGQTLSGAGTLQVWYCDSLTSLCYRNTALDQTISASGVRCAAVPDFKVGYVTGQPDSIVVVPSGVTVSSGTPLAVNIYAHLERYK